MLTEKREKEDHLILCRSPGNLQVMYPFNVVAIDHVSSLS